MRVVTIPCLSDNYAYLVTRDGSSDAVVIDPSEAAPVLAAAEREGLRIVAILNTHHHFDHVGGNEAIVAKLGAMPVYAHVSDEGRVPGQTEKVEEGKGFEVAGLSFSALHVPGHTLGAVSYCVEDAVFTGDTLFVAGCGRLFEGTPEQMHRSLFEKLGALPAETRVYCGHEYTLSNLGFAKAVEPENAAIDAAIEVAKRKREAGEPTVPSTIGDELAKNPFMRSLEPAVRAFAGSADASLSDASPAHAVLGAVRRAKDTFRG